MEGPSPFGTLRGVPVGEFLEVPLPRSQFTPLSELEGVRSANPSEFTGRFARVDPNDIRFSQTTAGGRGRAAQLRESMRNGWNGPAVDAVETPQGLVTIDNTRIAVARELGIGEVPVKVRLPSDPLPPSMLGRFGDSRTWGEALQFRTGRQRPPLSTSGTLDPPRMP